jgi:hypothetical protein
MEEYRKYEPKTECQFNGELPVCLRRTACGITSLYNAITVIEDGTNDDFKSFIKKFISYPRFNIPAYGVIFGDSFSDTTIPILYKVNSDNIEVLRREAYELVNLLNEHRPYRIERIDNPNFKPRMAFTLKYGFDHRGINGFLKENKYNLKSELFESEKIPQFLEKNSCMLLSVDHKHLGYPVSKDVLSNPNHISTHVVCVTAINDIGNTKVATYIDPAFENGNQTISRSLSNLQEAYSGKYSLISPK